MDTKIIIRRVGITFILVISFICFVCGISSARASIVSNKYSKPDRIDIRFLIDSSYAMKKNDPDKLRIRALQKIIKNLPETATSGVWTYGKYVNMLIPLGLANPTWKKKAIYELDKIDGYGNNRDLYAAVENAAHGWQDSPKGRKKYMVILTNGGLDLENMTAQKEQSRKMLLTRTLAKLKKSGVAIHVLSLSKDSDNRLLKILAKETGGKWYAVYNIKLLSDVMQHVYVLINNGNTDRQLSSAKIVAEVFKDDADKQDSANLGSLDNVVAPVIQSSELEKATEKTVVRKIRRASPAHQDLANKLEFAGDADENDWKLITAGQ